MWLEIERFCFYLQYFTARKDSYVTKHHGLAPHPRVAEDYIKNASSIKVHKHCHAGSCSLDLWRTKSPHQQQMVEILGFCFTNSYSTMTQCAKPKLQHHLIKIGVSNAPVSHTTKGFCETRQLNTSSVAILHVFEQIGYRATYYNTATNLW